MVEIREYAQQDIACMAEVWNEIVRDGIAFPQEDELAANQGGKRK